MKAKLENVIELVNNAMVDPDIDVECCMPEAETASDPYILVKYAEDDMLERKIRLYEKYMEKPAQEIADFVTFSIEQFKEEIDSLKYGAQ